MTIALVAISNALYSFDRLYSYIVPESLSVSAGQRVIVPFGKSTSRLGMVMKISKNVDTDENLKSIISVEDVAPVLSEELLNIVLWLKKTTFCTYFDAIKVILPPGMARICDTVYTLAEDIKNITLDDNEIKAYKILKRKKSELSKKNIEKSNPEILELIPKLLEKSVLFKDRASTQKISEKTVTIIKLTENYKEIPLTNRQAEIVEILEQNAETSVRELIYFSGASRDTISRLVKLGVCELSKDREFRKPNIEQYESEQTFEINLSKSQEEVQKRLYDLYKQTTGKTALLYGVTGSGKTQVFLKLCKRCIEDGKQAIILVPEIALTPQTISTFTAIFGQKIAVLHSSLSMGQRLDEWHRIHSGDVDVVVGTRSAIFAPLKNLGLIVIDEEHEHTYKSEHSPRYDAREIAKQRVKFVSGLCVLASATPSVESFFKAKQGKIELFTLRERYGDAKLPYVGIIDLKLEDMAGRNISDTLANEIQRNLNSGEQSIILVNRRGHSTLVRCGNCNDYVLCENCSISMKYHSANNSLVCHYCGIVKKYTGRCPTCNEENITFTGAGTQRLEHELNLRFPEAKILRMDTDTTVRRNVYEQLLMDFKSGKYDILVGTQMVAKGLNLPLVTLVGVVGVDNLLYSASFKNYERVFSLITQVVGRAGRYTKNGRAYIETYSPEHSVVLSAAAQDYDEFYEDEIRMRKYSLYPPFCVLIAFVVSSENENLAKITAYNVSKLCETIAKNDFSDMPIRLFGATPASLYKVSGKYRYNIVIKLKRDTKIIDYISSVLTRAKNENRDVNIYVEPSFEG